MASKQASFAHSSLNQKQSETAQDNTVNRHEILLKLIQQNNVVTAQQTLAQWLKETPDDINIQYYAGFWAYQSNNLQLAIQLLNQVTETLRAEEKPHLMNLWFEASDAYYFLGLAWYQANQLDYAVKTFWMGLQNYQLSESALSKFNAMIGLAYNACGFNKEAETHLTKATELNPHDPLYWQNLGCYQDRTYQFINAQTSFKTALELYQSNPEQYSEVDPVTLKLSLARTSSQLSQWEDSQLYYGEVLDARPSLSVILETAALLPNFYNNTEEQEEFRDNYQTQLTSLVGQSNLVPANTALKHLDELYNSPVFALPYHGKNDIELVKTTGKLLTQWVNPAQRERGQFKHYQRDLKKPLRVGIISRFLRPECTLGKLYLPLAKALGKKGVDVFLLHIQPQFQQGVHTKWTKSETQITGYLPAENTPLAVNLLEQAQLDVAFYPDVSTDSSAMLMALHRVAPVQCTSWGHANTSGLPAMDAYLSSQYLEPEGAQEHYTERLCLLKSLPSLYKPPVKLNWHPGESLRQSVGIPDEGTVYFCPQSLFKLHPEFDVTLSKILEKDSNGHLVFIDDLNGSLKDKLLKRLEKSLPSGSKARVHVAPRCKPETFLHWLTEVNVMLDPTHFGGGNTTLEAISMGVPVITWPSEFMRGRITYGCYQQMSCQELNTYLVATSEDDYVEKAIRIANNKDLYQQCSQWIASHRDKLWNENAVTQEFIDTFEELLQAASHTPE